ncbi:hypothetical protein CAP35_10535 [Chitinophagaceae bacterium IBVUCB1]|nr:hypothetical protein CAP35_10535 [Chitinophagaceae bacterium IBVUCB1]
MKRIIITTVLAAVYAGAYAQPGSGYARRAIEKKYENEHAADKQKGMDWLNNAMNGKTEEEYKFPMSLRMHITTYKDGEVRDENDIDYYLNGNEKYFAARMDDKNNKRKRSVMFMIYDYDNNSTVMIDENEKTYMAMNINAFMSAEAQANRGKQTTEGKYKNDCKKTGKTKTIEGYTCEEYVCTDEDRNRRSEIWIAGKLPIDISQSFMRSPYAYMGTNKMAGMMMEGSFYKNDQIESKMQITNLNQQANLNIVMSNYRQGMGR